MLSKSWCGFTALTTFASSCWTWTGRDYNHATRAASGIHSEQEKQNAFGLMVRGVERVRRPDQQSSKMP